MYRYSTSSNQSAFRSDYPLTNDQIAKYAPSVLATDPHESRGERYAFIPTIEVLEGLRAEEPDEEAGETFDGGFHSFSLATGKRRLPVIFSSSCKMPSISASGRGGQPGT